MSSTTERGGDQAPVTFVLSLTTVILAAALALEDDPESAAVKINGSAGRLELDQIIALTFKVNGAPGSLMEALKEPGDIYQFYAAGLVE